MRKIIVALSASVLALAARGNTIVFSDFGPGDTYSQNFAAGGPATSPLTEIAAQFTAGASGNLATVDLGLTYVTQGPANVFLYGDASDLPDNADQTLLGSITPTAVFGTTNNSLVSLSVSSTVLVTMGKRYWLVLKPAAMDEEDAWNLGAGAGLVAVSSDDMTWSTSGVVFLPAFRVTASGAARMPDSGGTFLLMFGSVVVLLALQRMFRRPVTQMHAFP